VSRRPKALPEAPEGYFQLTEWRPTSNGAARAARARWRASLAVLGIRAVEVEAEGFASLWREGEESVSEATKRMRRARDLCGDVRGRDLT